MLMFVISLLLENLYVVLSFPKTLYFPTFLNLLIEALIKSVTRSCSFEFEARFNVTAL